MSNEIDQIKRIATEWRAKGDTQTYEQKAHCAFVAMAEIERVVGIDPAERPKPLPSDRDTAATERAAKLEALVEKYHNALNDLAAHYRPQPGDPPVLDAAVVAINEGPSLVGGLQISMKLLGEG